MVYGGGDLCTAPWELVIKAYRPTLGDKSFPKLEDYATDFFNFIEKNKRIISDGMRDQNIYQYLSDGVFKPLMDSFFDTQQAELAKGFDPAHFFSELEEYCHVLLERLSDTEYLDGFSDDDLDEASSYCKSKIHNILNEHFSSLDPGAIPASFITTLNQIFTVMLCKRSDTGNVSGLVFAGYGDDDYYPKILSYDVCGFFNKKLRKSTNKNKCTSDGENGLTPFAQDDEVSAFMQGCSNELLGKFHSFYQDSISDLLGNIDNIIKSEISPDRHEATQDAIMSAVHTAIGTTDRQVSQFMHDNHVRKVVDMIKFLPKQDLAYMAESLVNLTAFKRKVSDDSETVGGPIDVAVISKADGFIWVKRKHYFEKEFNHHFFGRS